MPNHTPISPNMRLVLDFGFGHIDVPIIADILRSVDIELSNAIQATPFSSKPCLVSYSYAMDGPMCCNEGESHHIYLRTGNGYWAQWYYQFAHEYCHHLIDGALSGEVTGLIWFEETICELSSMYNLQRAAESWTLSHNPTKVCFVPALRSYLDNLLLQEETNKCAAIPCKTIGAPLEYLSKERQYHRDLYRCFATMLFPLFLSNPRLWKIILHFGDMRGWNSLEELFGHLERTSSDDYRDSLLQMENLLFS